ncbi:ComEA family DNA-binding protein [Corynebacterium epidermidicanis]|uniref:Competence protein ComEA-like protein with helix-hairpin-helix repeat region n=1 Tax=Corynebacterium epidermidicanis TaxID=1050174 RepID=A0A0G3GY65_9CORY|nr:ComEA family DNA-binding protein [Corynebacterium epidermidicanis]AKK03767.1 competence protein ComEA-like protein with helix-hairpin-helix repeat region [Corynebacterium epidermidicanis]
MNVTDRVKELTRPTGEEDLMHVRYPKPRWEISLRSGLFLALAVLVSIAGFAMLRRPPQLAPVTNPYALAATPTSAPTAATDFIVSVGGAVVAPGLVTLTPGARVADALSAATPAADAHLRDLNLAHKLVDGQHLVIPRVGEPASSLEPSGRAPGKVSLNSADAKALEDLPGVGAKTAEAIIAYREQSGGFTSIEQLKEVKGIGPSKFEKMKDQATL